jgi:hypothetical protein
MKPFAAESVLAEAQRQIAAAQKAGFSVEWVISEKKAMTQLGDLFKSNGIPITLRLLPE